MGITDKLIPAFAYGASFGTLMYIVASVASAAGGVPGITPTIVGAMGFTAAIAIHLSKPDKK